MAELVNGGCDIVGILEQRLPLATGESARGPWERQDIVIALTDVQYPTRICVELFNNSAHLADNIADGTKVRVSVNIQSREYQGRWFTGIRGWRIEPVADAAPVQNAAPQGYQQPAPAPQPASQAQSQQGVPNFPTQGPGTAAGGGVFDDLPF
ncbi:MAG: hypothetical protein CSA07_02625 [Bacteroidia bacterium]|nr:MAG: hypothetical protein CSA07_02625 [Bacteroidia bacterium]